LKFEQIKKKMKKLVLYLLIITPFASFGQYDYGFLQEIFFGRQPSARAEALGRSYAAVDGDLTTIFFNPAGTATLKGLEIDGSYAAPYFYPKKQSIISWVPVIQSTAI
jgi:outer membrane receptor protein involved in Fe transport